MSRNTLDELKAPLVRLYEELVFAVEKHPLATLNEGFLQIIAKEALIKGGAKIVSFTKDGYWKVISLNRLRELLVHERTPDPLSLVGTKDRRGHPHDADTPDIRILRSDKSLFRIEIKAGCDFGSSGGSDLGRINSDLDKLKRKERDAFIFVADEKTYRNRQRQFSQELPKLSEIQRFPSIERKASFFLWAQFVSAEYISGNRILLVVALDEPVWVLEGFEKRERELNDMFCPT